MSGVSPTFIGTTPGGAEWYARAPDEVPRLTARLNDLWARYNAKPNQLRRARKR